MIRKIYCIQCSLLIQLIILQLSYFILYYPPVAEEVKESGVMYDLPTAPVRDKKSDPATTVNDAYGVLQGLPTTDNLAYGQVHR